MAGLNGKQKILRSPIFEKDGEQFIISCDKFTCEGHQAALEAGRNHHKLCKYKLQFTGLTAALPAVGTGAIIGNDCPVLILED